MPRKYNVLHIITTLELGGAQKSALALIQGLDPQLYTKYFISGPEGSLQEEASRMREVTVTVSPYLRRRIHPFYDFLAVGWLVRFMRARRIDIVHTHSSKAGIIGRMAARIAGVPVVIHTVHGWSFNAYQHVFVRRLYIFLERCAGRWTNKFIAVSRADIAKGLHNGIGTRDDYVLACCGVDRSIASGTAPAYRKEDLGIAASRPVVGVVACFKPQKNLTDMIAAARRVADAVPDVVFVCVGDGGQRRLLEQRIAENGLEDHFRLFGWRKDIARIFPVFDVAALSSLWEGLPITLLEAMFFAKPVVAYGVDGIPEIIQQNVTGFLVPPGQVTELAAKITELLRDKSRREQFGLAGKTRVAILLKDSDSMPVRVEETYAALLRARENSGQQG